jgi:hypothetical protein
MFDFHTFDDCLTVADVKAKYRRLAFKTHPDVHPHEQFDKWNAEMQSLNGAYFIECQKRDGEVFTGDDQREHTYRYNENTEAGVVAAVARTIRAKLPDHITVTIVGIYVWVEGTRREDVEARAILKGDGEDSPTDRFYWHSKRRAWYWKPSNYRARYNRSASLDDLKSYYGARTVDKEDNKKLAIA